MKNKEKYIPKCHVLQRYQSDCGIASLLSIIRYHQGNDSLERLRELSGTTMHGTTMPKLFFDNRKIGDFVARLNDTHRIQEVIKSMVGSTVLDSMVCIISIVFLCYYSWMIALICITSLPFYFYLIYRNRKEIIDTQKAVMQAYALNESNYISTIQGIDTIKNFNKQVEFENNNKLIYGGFQDNSSI